MACSAIFRCAVFQKLYCTDNFAIMLWFWIQGGSWNSFHNVIDKKSAQHVVLGLLLRYMKWADGLCMVAAGNSWLSFFWKWSDLWDVSPLFFGCFCKNKLLTLLLWHLQITASLELWTVFLSCHYIRFLKFIFENCLLFSLFHLFLCNPLCFCHCR